jgi:hypothetical protein
VQHLDRLQDPCLDYLEISFAQTSPVITRIPIGYRISFVCISDHKSTAWHPLIHLALAGLRARPDPRGFSAAVFPRSIAKRSEAPSTRGRVIAQAGKRGFGGAKLTSGVNQHETGLVSPTFSPS